MTSNNACQTISLCAPKLISQGFVYYFNSGTLNSDPGAGSLKYNQIIQSNTTAIYIDYISATNSDITNYIQNIAVSTNPILGQIYVVKADNSGKGQVFNVTAVNLYLSYAALTVSLVNEMNGPNPLVFGDAVVFSFVQAGDEGTPGGPQGFQGSAGAQGFQGVAGTAGGSSAPNNPTNHTFVGSGQTPTLAGASAANGQTSTATFSTTAMIFMITLGTEGQYILCGTSYGSNHISAIDDPGSLFLNSDSGIGLYIFKSSNSFTVSFKNRTGASDIITVQSINSAVTSATVWA